MISKIKFSILILLAFTANAFAFAPPFPPPSNNGSGAPIDSGIYWLVFIGVTLGLIYKLKKTKQHI